MLRFEFHLLPVVLLCGLTLGCVDSPAEPAGATAAEPRPDIAIVPPPSDWPDGLSASMAVSDMPVPGTFLRAGAQPQVYLYLGGNRSVLVPDWHTYLACSGGGANLIREVSSIPGSQIGVLPSAKEHRWIGGFRPVTDGATVYIIAGCVRVGFPTPAALQVATGTQAGLLNWNRVLRVDAAVLQRIPVYSEPIKVRPYPQRTLIQQAGSPEVRLVLFPGVSLGIPSADVFLSHCFAWQDVQIVDGETFASYQTWGTLQAPTAGCSEADRIPVADGFDYAIGATETATIGAGDSDGYARTQKFNVWRDGYGYHDGEDWARDYGDRPRCGDAIYAPANARIVKSQVVPPTQTTGWGNALMLRHRLPNGAEVETTIAHAQNLIRTAGVVRRGELIAELGTTGKSTACHLHWGTRFRNSPYWGSSFGTGYSTAGRYIGMTASSSYAEANRTLIVP